MSLDPTWIQDAIKTIAASQVSAAQASVSPNVAQASVVIAAANPRRMGYLVYNNGSNSCYICLGATASGALCHKILASFATWECYGPVCYTGVMSAIRNAGTGTINVCELLRP